MWRFSRTKRQALVVACAVLGAVALAALATLCARFLRRRSAAEYSDVAPIVQARCLPCHSKHPTNSIYKRAPNGIAFDTPAQVRASADRIRYAVVELRNMPLANITHMSEEERQTISSWVEAGAPPAR